MFWRTRKSAGVAVTAPVHRIISLGNAARDRRNWKAAAAHYEAALKSDPSLAHIWVQLGHSLKESGAYKPSEAAYRRAIELAPDDSDAPLHLGHLFHLTRRNAEAGRFYLRSYRADPQNVDAITGLHRIIANATGRARAGFIDFLRASLKDQPETDFLPSPTTRPTSSRPSQTAIVFDTSDLLAFFVHSRLPTGIQRVHIEVINNTIRTEDRDIHICCVIAGRDEWLEMPASLFLTVTTLCLTSGDREDPIWVGALNRLRLYLALSVAFVFPHRATLVALGASWSNPNYFLLIRAAMAHSAIRYVPLVYDMIPIVTPQHCVAGHKRDFIYWVLGVLVHAESFLVISEATKRDLIEVGALLGRVIPPDSISVIPLDADFRKPTLRQLPQSRLAKWRLDDGPFILLVSTIESRKGHTVALEAWSQLIARYGARAIPRLVCVGNKGWMNGDVYRRLDEDKTLASRITMLQGIADDDLALLYRSCLFTIYPSLYEGWGLPITESFCYGKPVITTTSTSLPEAGGPFAVYVEPGSAPGLADAIHRLVTNTADRNAINARIQQEFRPRQWTEIAKQVETELTRLAARGPSPRRNAVPSAQLGTFYPVSRSVASRVWPGLGTGEIFRVGTGWEWPHHDGCWTRIGGGVFAFAMDAEAHQGGQVRISLMILGAPSDPTLWRVTIEDGPSLAGSLAPAARRWVQLTAAVPADGIFRVRLRTLVRESLNDADVQPDHGSEQGQEPAPPMAGLGGFFIHRDGDSAAAQQLLEAIAFNSLTDLDAYREHLPAVDPDALEDVDWSSSCVPAAEIPNTLTETASTPVLPPPRLSPPSVARPHPPQASPQHEAASP